MVTMRIDPTDIRLAGAVPLNPRPAQTAPSAPSLPVTTANGAVAVIDVTEATFEAEVLNRSSQVPVVIDFWADWCGPCKQLSPVLERLAVAAGGAWVLAKIDVDANPRLAQAAAVQGIPAVKAVINGQVVGEFTGAVPEAQVKVWVGDVVKMAAEMGLPPVPGAEPVEEEPTPPYLLEADEALARDDLPGAIAAFSTEVAANPGNEDAKAGLAQLELMLRIGDADPETTLAATLAKPDDVEASLLMADLELAAGDLEASFERLLGVIRRGAGPGREAARTRLLDLFRVVGSDHPVVVKSRRDLTTALF
jgi:putative thioredoxin